MKMIPLTRGLFALVDDKDYDYLNQWKWHAEKSSKTFYARRHWHENKLPMYQKMEHAIMDCPKGFQLDHIDRNGLNNQKNNLRICNASQNCINRTISRKIEKVSQYRGVYYERNHRGVPSYIRASIKANGLKIKLGIFKTEEDAARAYDEAAKKYHGEFACLNFN